jgi:transcriptional regulator with XRE-family HTH domain
MIQRYRLRQIREQRGLSQGALGQLLGKDAKYISKLELGVRSGVTSTTLARMAVALGVSADYLLGISDRATPAPHDSLPPSAERQGTPEHAA